MKPSAAQRSGEIIKKMKVRIFPFMINMMFSVNFEIKGKILMLKYFNLKKILCLL